MNQLLLDAFVNFESSNVFNPWGETDPLDLFWGSGDDPTYRVNRLRQHFDCKPLFLLVGEAPGYQGCHFSGVPFTNEKLIMRGVVPRVTLETGRITTRALPFSEPSATIVWGALHDLGIADSVVMWNAFAWHPHKPGDPYSNRAPSQAELQRGMGVLCSVLAHFPGVPVVALGKVAERTLRGLRISTAACLRHPSMGGANDFRRGLKYFVQNKKGHRTPSLTPGPVAC